MKEVQPRSGVRWVHGINMLLGAWLVASPFMMEYRSVPLEWSDMASGALIFALSALSLSPRGRWAPWGVGVVGFWLLCAPLVFWAPTAAVYANDTLVGMMAIGLALLVPGVPGARDLPGPDAPPGWSYNPSDWGQRTPVIAFAFVSFFLSRYLSAYQLGHIDTVWDPFFGDGTRRILESDVSKAFPVSDAGLGAVSYLFEALTGFFGGTRRWRTMPWMVVLFSLQVVPLGVVSMVLVVLQPVSVGAWCFLCLLTALMMLLMIPPAVDEVFATMQFLIQTKREGKSVWAAFWSGGSVDRREGDPRVPLSGEENWLTLAGRLPWHLIGCAVLGGWLLASPDLLGATGLAAASSHILGALIAAFAFIAIAEVTRAARYVLLPFAALVLLAPFVLSGATPAMVWNNLAVGAVLIPLCLARGRIYQRYGHWDKIVV